MNVDILLYKDIDDYCSINGLDTSKYINDLLKDAFMKDKYGTAPRIGKFTKKEEKCEKESTIQTEKRDTNKSIKIYKEEENEIKQETVKKEEPQTTSDKKPEKSTVKPRKRKL